MRTRDGWPREQFMHWLDGQRELAGYTTDYALAEAAGISHSTLSGWRSGRQTPTTKKLAVIAEALNIDPRHLWVRAGLMTPEEVGLEAGAEPVPLTDPDEVTREMIRNAPDLDEVGKRQLLSMLDEQVRDDAERRRSLFARLVTAGRTVKA